MKYRTQSLGRTIAGAALVTIAAATTSVTFADDIKGGDRADTILKDMGRALSEAETLKVTVVREVDPELMTRTGMPEQAEMEVALMRPDKLKATSDIGDHGVRHFYADGKNVTIADDRLKVYSLAPMQGNIDVLALALDEQFGFVPPMGEILSNDPYTALRDGAQSVRYTGARAVKGESCHRIVIRGADADAELYVGAEDNLPCRLDVKFTQIAGEPKTRMTFSDWTVGPELDATDFVYTPPAGFRKVDAVPFKGTEEPRAALEPAS